MLDGVLMAADEDPLKIFLPDELRSGDVHRVNFLNQFALNMFKDFNHPRISFLRERVADDFRKQLFTDLVDNPRRADFIFWPWNIRRSLKDEKFSPIFRSTANMAAKLDVPMVVDSQGDRGLNRDIDPYIIQLVNFFTPGARHRQIVIPGLHRKIMNDSSLDPQEAIGFCGHAFDLDRDVGYFWENKRLTAQYLRWRFNCIRYESLDYRIKRGLGLNKLKSRFPFKCNFLIRDYWARDDNVTDNPGLVTKEFDNNVLSNKYTYCPVGAGPFSLRLFEVLSAGRTPLVDVGSNQELKRQLPFDKGVRDLVAKYIVTLNLSGNGESDDLSRYACAPANKVQEMYEEIFAPQNQQRLLWRCVRAFK